MLAAESRDCEGCALPQRDGSGGGGARDRQADLPSKRATTLGHSASPVLEESGGQPYSTEDQQLLPEIPGAHFLAWRVPPRPPSLRKNTLAAKQHGPPTQAARSQTICNKVLHRAHVASPLHDLERKQHWLRSANLGCTSLPMTKEPRPHILLRPCPQADNIKQTLERYRSRQREPLLSLLQRPPTVSSLPQSLQGAMDMHCKTYCQFGQKDGRLATHPDRGIPILSAPAAVYYNTRHQSRHFVIHPEWHL